jgi:C-terminal processing protease CtpA/Prc
MARRLILAAALAAVSTVTCAQTGAQLEQQAGQARAARDYPRAGALLEQAYALKPEAPVELYNAACAYALGGDTERAFRLLERALDKGFVDADNAAKDGDLAALRGDARWPLFIKKMKQRQALDAKLFDSSALASGYRDNLTEDEKVAGLSKFWSEVKYNFVYTDTLKELDWDKLYLDYLPKVRATSSTAEYYRVLMQLSARLKDGHTGIWPAKELLNTEWAKPQFKTHLVQGHVLVRSVFDPELIARGVAPGTEIVAVDGEPATAYAQRAIVPYVSASTPQDLEARTYGFQFLQGPVGTTPRVTFRTAAGKIFDADVKRVGFEKFFELAPKDAPFELRMLPGNVAYVALNGFGDDQAADGYIAAFEQIARSSALVIDLRNNGGGNSSVGYRVLATLTDKPFAPSRWATRDYRPTYRAWQLVNPDHEELDESYPADPAHQYTKPVAVLTSAGTYSAAEDFMVAFDSMKRGPIVGEATGGSTGQPLILSLPGGGRARICTKRDTYPDGRRWVGTGILPTVKASPLLADLRRGRDTVLEAALEALRR